MCADDVVIFDEQNRFASTGLLALRSSIGMLDRTRFAGTRKIDLHRRTVAELRIDLHMTAGLLDETVDHRETEARAFADFLGREERLESARNRCRIHADAGVGDGDQ